MALSFNDKKRKRSAQQRSREAKKVMALVTDNVNRAEQPPWSLQEYEARLRAEIKSILDEAPAAFRGQVRAMILAELRSAADRVMSGVKHD